MGVSGPRLYEDDDFFIYLESIVSTMQKDIENCFLKLEQGQLLLGDVNDTLIPAIDIAITLYEKYNYSISVTESTIRKWKTACLRLYDEKIGDYGARPSYIPERRKVIEDLFTRFEIVSFEDDE